MYLHWPTASRGLVTGLLRRPWRFRRVALILSFTVLFALVWLLAAVGRALDRVFFPAFRRTPVTAPVFIIAAPRSGTTFLHRLLSLDREQFTHFRLIDMIFPAIVYERLFSGLARLDRRLDGPLATLVARFEKLCFGDWDDRHAMGFARPEEDEALFTLTLTTEAVYLLFPYFRELPPVAFLDRLPARARAGAMAFYKRSAQRRLFAVGGGTLLAKTTGGAGRIRSLFETFPDARIIHLVRHPAETLPSHVSVFYPTWAAHSPEIGKVSPETRAYAEVAVDWYRAMYDARDLIDRRQGLRVRYDALVADPVATVEAIYRHFDLPLAPAFRERLTAAAEAARGYASQHDYSLAEYGLSPDWVRSRLGDVIDAYDLEPPAAVAAAGGGS